MDNGAEEATAVPILEPIGPSPGIEDVELPEEAKSKLDEDDSSKEEGDGSESEGGSDNSDYVDYWVVRVLQHIVIIYNGL